MATHSSVFALRIPGMGEPGGLPSMGSHRVRHDCTYLAAAAALAHFNSLFCNFIHCFGVYTAAKSLQSCPTLCDPTRLPRPWDSPGKNTGVGCHFLLQCMKVKSESEVPQSCLTLSNPMDCRLPGSSAHGIFQARVLEWVAIAFS